VKPSHETHHEHISGTEGQLQASLIPSVDGPASLPDYFTPSYPLARYMPQPGYFLYVSWQQKYRIICRPANNINYIDSAIAALTWNMKIRKLVIKTQSHARQFLTQAPFHRLMLCSTWYIQNPYLSDVLNSDNN
jgi:hypothetical protein